MSIEDEVKQAIAEFGDDAHKRFNNVVFASFVDLRSNALLLLAIDSGDVIKKKPLPELFAHDVEVYGDNAYLMLEWLGSYFPKQFKNNADVSKTLNTCKFKYLGNLWEADNGLKIRRKTSAALPFDLLMAKNCDVVECYSENKGEWIDCSFRASGIDGVLIGTNAGLFLCSPDTHLRMKYPPKINRGK